jgi:hypothetical protein
VTGQFSLAKFASIAILGLVLGACSSGPQVVQTLHDAEFKGVTFHSVLVIGVASDHTARSQFERQVVSGINATGASATAYHTVLGRNPSVNRNDITNAIRSRGFDAVLVTRVKGQERSFSESQSAPVTTQDRRNVDGNAFNLFRYDYVELNDPATINVTATVNLVTELYSAADEKKVWAIETVNSAEHVGLLIDEESAAIVRELSRDKLIGPRD